MSQSAWPVITDIDDAYTSAGLTPPSDRRKTIMLAAAIDMFSRATGYNPFLAGTQTRYFDPPGPLRSPGMLGGGFVLRLSNGLVSVSSLTIAGVSKTADTDFFLKPYNAPNDFKPYERIKFACAVYGQPKSIVITGAWGYGAAIPDDAWLGVLDLACAMCRPEVDMALTPGAVIKWNIRDKGETLSENATKALNEWVETANTAIRLFLRVASFV